MGRNANAVRLCHHRCMITRLGSLTTQWTFLVPVLAVVLLLFPGAVICQA